MHEAERKADRRLQPDNAVGSMRELLRAVMRKRLRVSAEETSETLHFFRYGIMRRVIRRDRVDRSVGESVKNGFDVLTAPKRRRHLRVGSRFQNRAVIEREMMRRGFAGDIRGALFRGTNQFDGIRG